MTEGPDCREKGLEELDEEITCPICREHFRDPKVLPCCHYYCRECIQQLAARAGPNRPFPCPHCREDTLLPQNDPSQLHTAFFVNRLKELYAKMEKAEGKVEAVCEMCSEGKAEAFCRQCTDFICQDCVKSHQKLKVFAGHEVVTLEELKKGGAKRIPLKEPPSMVCKEHDEQMKIFCFDCNCLICRDCIVIDHAGHKYEFVKKTIPQCREELMNQLAPLQKIRDNLPAATKQIEAAKAEVSNQGAALATSIEQSFDDMIDVLKQRKQQLMMMASNIVQQKVNALVAQEKNSHLSIAEIQSLIEFVEQNCKNATDEELMMIHKQILSRVGEECKKHTKQAVVNVPASFLISTPDVAALVSTCQRLGETPVVGIEGTFETAEVSKQAEVILYLSEQQYQRAEAELCSVVDGSVTAVKVTPNGEGSYKLTYVPKIRGRHTLNITINRKPVAGSPFQVFAKIHPSQLGEPVRVITVLNKPWGVAFNSQQQLVVSEWSGKRAVVLTKTGERLHAIDAIKFDRPAGVAVDKDDTIYIGDQGSLCKISSDGQPVKVRCKKGKQLGELYDVGSVRIINDNVYVCERSNHRIQVFTKELEFVQSFGSKGSKTGQFCDPDDIIQDQMGSLYVTDRGNNRLQVFTSKWEFVRELGVGKLQEPTCVCFDASGFLFVGSWVSGSVSVFSPTGEMVTSFCKEGRKVGELISPCCIAFDEDGFLYVTDVYNARIQVF